MKKIIVSCIGVLSLLLILTGCGTNVKENQSVNNNNNDNQNDNNTNEEVVETDTLKKMTQEVISEIKKAREDDSLNLMQESEKTLSALYINYDKITGQKSNFKCESPQNSSEVNCNGADSSNYIFDFNAPYFNYDQVGIIYLFESSPYKYIITIPEFLSYLNFKAYYGIIEQQGAKDFYEEKEKYGLSSKDACVGYSDEGNYFYINLNKVVDNPKAGWYSFDRYTGECDNTIETVARYKIDKATNKYELVQK